MSQLTLYYSPSCSFCQKVLRFLKDANIKVTLKNIYEKDEYRQELITIGGKSQVPCLFIDGKPLYESNDIIDWLSQYDHK